MRLLTSAAAIGIAILSAVYSACAFVQYRAVWQRCRSRLTVPRAVELFYARLARNDFRRLFPDAGGSPVAQASAALPAAHSPLFPVSCPIAFIEYAAFDANVRAVGSSLLAHGKQIRLATRSLRCPELLERTAAVLEQLAHPCADYEIIGSAPPPGAPGRPFVAGLLTATAAETLQWAQRGSFASLLLGRPIADAAGAARFVEAMTLGAGAPRVRCQLVADAVKQLEFLWDAARAWIMDRGYARLGFDNAVESLHFSVLILVDVAPRGALDALMAAPGSNADPRALRTPADVMRFAAAIDAFNTKIAGERLPVGVRFSIGGVWVDEGAPLALADTGPLASPAARCALPARWFLRFPLVQWYKRRAASRVRATRRELLQRLRGGDGGGKLLVSGGCSASFVSSALDDTLTEVCVGAGLLCGHQMDRYADSLFLPALYVALTVTHCAPGRGLRCAGFGQSLPRAEAVYPPRHVALHKSRASVDEELETAIAVLEGAQPVAVGSPVVFRPERAGALAELVDTFMLVSASGEVEGTVRTYRGEGWNLWS